MKYLVYVIMEIAEVGHDPLDNGEPGRAREDKGGTKGRRGILIKLGKLGR